MGVVGSTWEWGCLTTFRFRNSRSRVIVFPHITWYHRHSEYQRASGVTHFSNPQKLHVDTLLSLPYLSARKNESIPARARSQYAWHRPVLHDTHFAVLSLLHFIPVNSIAKMAMLRNPYVNNPVSEDSRPSVELTLRLSSTKYRPFPPLNLPNRQWPSKSIQKPPRWLSTDLRDVSDFLERWLVC